MSYEYQTRGLGAVVRENKWPNLDIPSWRLLSATAAHLSEALTRTLGKWEAGS